MNHKLITLVSALVMSSALLAQTAVLTVYADGCNQPNTLTCNSGTQVSLTAKEEVAGSRFVQWSDGNTENPRVVTITSDITYTAQYTSNVVTNVEHTDAVNTGVDTPAKLLRDGQIFIRRGDCLYNLQGQVVE